MNNESLSARLILASSSKYRKMLLQRLGVPFDCRSPDIDETALENESPRDLVMRLASEKAREVCRQCPSSTVIGSDQLALFNNRVVGKPGSQPVALQQLLSFSGHSIEFLTAVSVQCHESGFTDQHIDSTLVHFRVLEQEEIERYLEKEQPFDCAGAFKAESLGITLFERISSDDPTALIGLPLIQTAKLLRRSGFQLP